MVPETADDVAGDEGMPASRAAECEQLLLLMLKYSSAPDGSFSFLLQAAAAAPSPSPLVPPLDLPWTSP